MSLEGKTAIVTGAGQGTDAEFLFAAVQAVFDAPEPAPAVAPNRGDYS